jgi:hypothetical protein
VTERPPNLRPSRATERSHNSGHHHEESRRDEDRGASRSYGISSSTGSSYRGSHRAEHMQRAEDTGSIAHQRSSRVGHHHGDQHPGQSSRRWRIA